MTQIINVKVIPRTKKIEVKKETDSFKVYLTAPAIESKANNLLLKVLADYFKVNKSSIEILRGQKSRQKVVKIDGL